MKPQFQPGEPPSDLEVRALRSNVNLSGFRRHSRNRLSSSETTRRRAENCRLSTSFGRCLRSSDAASGNACTKSEPKIQIENSDLDLWR